MYISVCGVHVEYMCAICIYVYIYECIKRPWRTKKKGRERERREKKCQNFFSLHHIWRTRTYPKYSIRPFAKEWGDKTFSCHIRTLTFPTEKVLGRSRRRITDKLAVQACLKFFFPPFLFFYSQPTSIFITTSLLLSLFSHFFKAHKAFQWYNNSFSFLKKKKKIKHLGNKLSQCELIKCFTINI